MDDTAKISVGKHANMMRAVRVIVSTSGMGCAVMLVLLVSFMSFKMEFEDGG